MDRAMLERHLALTERHVAEGKGIVTKQRRLVAELAGKGLDTLVAAALLNEFEATQDMHVDHRDRLLTVLAKTRV
jgi:hypothetical protein